MLAIIAVLVLGGGWYVAKDRFTNSLSTSSSTASPTPAGTTPEREDGRVVTEEVDNVFSYEGDTKVFSLAIDETGIKPKAIIVYQGDKVRLVLAPSGQAYDLLLDGLNLTIPSVVVGTTGDVEFTADQVGEFKYHPSSSKEENVSGTLYIQAPRE